VIIFVLMVCSFAVATNEFVLVGVLGQVASNLSVSVATAGLLVTAFMIVGALGGPTATIVTRHVPRRALLIATMTLALVAAIASALAPTYGTLLAARAGSALAQALFMAVASQIAIAAVEPQQRTAAVAKVFNGFAVATVVGLPLGTLIGQAYGWRAVFVAVAILTALGLVGVLAFCPPIAAPPAQPLLAGVRPLFARRPASGLLVTLLALTAFVTAFTYVEPTLRDVTGLAPGWVTLALFVYGGGTIAGNLVAGRVAPRAITSVLPIAVGVLAVALAAQGLSVRLAVAAVAGLFILGAATFIVVPLIQTWLMTEVGDATAALAASVNISAAGLAGAAGSALGAVVIAGPGLAWIGPVAAVPAAAAVLVALTLRPQTAPTPVDPIPVGAARQAS
jgi:DHA1 family inner membrane transport protein